MSIIDQYLKLKNKDRNFLKLDVGSIDMLYSKKLKNTDIAVKCLKEHIDKNNHILVYTDYDCDFN